jgi:hypothetical protein
MAKERLAEIRGLFNIPVTIISRKIFLPKIINKYPRNNLKEKKTEGNEFDSRPNTLRE